MICPTCNRTVADGVNFCPYCGTMLPGYPNSAGTEAVEEPAGRDSILDEDRKKVREIPDPPHDPYAVPDGHGRAIASLIVGILAVLFFGIILGIIAIVLSNTSAPSRTERETAAVAGKVLGIIAIIKGVLVIALVVLIVVGIMTEPAAFDGYIDQAEGAITPLLMGLFY